MDQQTITDDAPAAEAEPRQAGFRVELPDGTAKVYDAIRVKLPTVTVAIDLDDVGRTGQEIHGTWRARFGQKLDFDADGVLLPLTGMRAEVLGLVAPRPADPTLFDAEREERRHHYSFRVVDGVYVVECSCGDLAAEAADETEAHIKGRRHIRVAILGHKAFSELAEGHEGFTVACSCGWRGDGVATDEEQAEMWIERHLEEVKDDPLPTPPRAESEDDQPDVDQGDEHDTRLD